MTPVASGVNKIWLYNRPMPTDSPDLEESVGLNQGLYELLDFNKLSSSTKGA
jgi:hypothetical protein